MAITREPPKLACSDGTRVLAAPAPEATWFCARPDGTKHGAFLTLFPDQTIEIEGSYRDGKLDGPWKRLHHGGALAEQGAYVAGIAVGTWRQHAASGNVLGEYTLKQGTGTRKQWLDDGRLYSEVTLKHGVPHGLARIFDPAGQVAVTTRFDAGKPHGARVVGSKSTLRIEETFVRGVRRGPRKVWKSWALVIDEAYDARGRLDGPFAMWRDGRTPRVQGQYASGKRVGAWVWTDRGNRKEREGHYADGKKHGAWSEWLDGKLLFQGAYADGKPDGELVYYDRRGGELGRFTVKKGTGTMVTFHPNRRPATRKRLVNGLAEGKYEELTLLGKLVVEGSYLRGEKHGPWRTWTEAGVPVLEAHFKHGRLDGVFKKFVDGKLAVEAMYRDGKAEGTYTEYRDGKPALVGSFVDDRRNGTWTSYAADGTVTLTATYKDGILDGAFSQLIAGSVLDGQMVAGRRSGTWTQTDRAGRSQSFTIPTP